MTSVTHIYSVTQLTSREHGRHLEMLILPLVQETWVYQGINGSVVLVAQSCLILTDPMDFCLPGSSVNGILQGRILEWVAIPFSRASSQCA